MQPLKASGLGSFPEIPHVMKSKLLIALATAVVLGVALFCRSNEETPATPDELVAEILKDPESTAKKQLASMDSPEAVQGQVQLGRGFEQQNNLKEAYFWYRTAEEHGCRPTAVLTPAHELYRFSRTGNCAAGEGMLAYLNTREAAPWQSLVGDGYELSDIDEAHKWWDLAAANGYDDGRNKYPAPFAWACRHWVLILIMLVAALILYGIHADAATRVPQNPAPPKPKQIDEKRPEPSVSRQTPGAPVRTVPLNILAGPRAVPIPLGSQTQAKGK